jgi:hypothetical protein
VGLVDVVDLFLTPPTFQKTTRGVKTKYGMGCQQIHQINHIHHPASARTVIPSWSKRQLTTATSTPNVPPVTDHLARERVKHDAQA